MFLKLPAATAGCLPVIARPAGAAPFAWLTSAGGTPAAQLFMSVLKRASSFMST